MNQNHLFNLDHLSPKAILKIFRRTDYLKQIGVNAWRRHYHHLCQGKTLFAVFFEASTRTEYSFLTAAAKLGLATVTLHRDNSAFTNKAETFYDTIKTVEQMQPDLIVIRSPITAYYEDLTNVAVPIINGGDGTGRHPTQSLLDLYTIYAEYGGDLKDKQVLYIGDILHSRVAKTGIMLMKKFGMQVWVTGPDQFADPRYNNVVTLTDSVLQRCDVINLLRYQFERHASRQKLNPDVFFKTWGLNKSRYEQLKPSAIIMHPGPVNRGVEIAGTLVESPKSRILAQVKNGFYLRAALITLILENQNLW